MNSKDMRRWFYTTSCIVLLSSLTVITDKAVATEINPVATGSAITNDAISIASSYNNSLYVTESPDISIASNNAIEVKTTSDDVHPSNSVTDQVITESSIKVTESDIKPKQTPKRKKRKKHRVSSNTIYYVKDGTNKFYLNEKYQNYLYKKLKQYNMTDMYEMCLALMYHESRFTVNIVSPTHDHGLMQINEANYGWLSKTLGITSLDNPYDNIDCGVYMLHYTYEKYGDIETALVAYNQGGRGLYKGVKASTKYSQSILNDINKLVKKG